MAYALETPVSTEDLPDAPTVFDPSTTAPWTAPSPLARFRSDTDLSSSTGRASSGGSPRAFAAAITPLKGDLTARQRRQLIRLGLGVITSTMCGGSLGERVAGRNVYEVSTASARTVLRSLACEDEEFVSEVMIMLRRLIQAEVQDNTISIIGSLMALTEHSLVPMLLVAQGVCVAVGTGAVWLKFAHSPCRNVLSVKQPRGYSCGGYSHHWAGAVDTHLPHPPQYLYRSVRHPSTSGTPSNYHHQVTRSVVLCYPLTPSPHMRVCARQGLGCCVRHVGWHVVALRPATSANLRRPDVRVTVGAALAAGQTPRQERCVLGRCRVCPLYQA